jgi:hypothetical protein
MGRTLSNVGRTLAGRLARYLGAVLVAWTISACNDRHDIVPVPPLTGHPSATVHVTQTWTKTPPTTH